MIIANIIPAIFPVIRIETALPTFPAKLGRRNARSAEKAINTRKIIK